MSQVVVVTDSAASLPEEMYDRYQMMMAVGVGARIRLALTHAAPPKDAETLRGLVEKGVTPVKVLVCELCPALTVHTGPGTVGLCYVPESI